MLKRLITTTSQDARHSDERWLDLDQAAAVEVTSEEKDYDIESALVSGEQVWRASSPGTQTIRLMFDQPQRLKRKALILEETETERTQEFVLRWSADGGHSFREIVRQQWNFSPLHHTRDRGISRSTLGCHRSRIGHRAGHPSRSGSRFAQDSAGVLTRCNPLLSQSHH
jgi:hypothetical protein